MSASAVPITVPSVGESISEGILSRWLKADGESVQAGEPLFELETDKASSVVPAPSSGVLKIQAKEGETVAIGATVATIDPAGSPAASRRRLPSARRQPSRLADRPRGTRRPPAPVVAGGRRSDRRSRRLSVAWWPSRASTSPGSPPPGPAGGSPRGTS